MLCSLFKPTSQIILWENNFIFLLLNISSVSKMEYANFC